MAPEADAPTAAAAVNLRNNEMKHERVLSISPWPCVCSGLSLIASLSCVAALGAQAPRKAGSKLLRQADPRPGTLLPPVLGPAKDSAQAVRIAVHALTAKGSSDSFRVASYASVDGGYLIKLQHDPPTPGGGALFWIEADGSARVLRRSR